MDFGLDKFLTGLLKELLERGFIKLGEKHAEFFLKFPYTKMAEVAAELLMDLLKKCFSYIWDFFNNKEEAENPIVEIIKKMVKKCKLVGEKITTYLKAAIDLLYKLWKEGFNCGKEKMRNGSKFVNDITKMVIPLDYPPNLQCSCACERKDDPVRENSDEHKLILSVTETRTVSRNVTLIQNRSDVTQSDEMKSEGIIGTRIITNSKFKGNDQGEKKFWYYIGNVNKEASEQDVLDYLTQNIPNGKFTCKKLYSKSHGQSIKTQSIKRQSFKVSVNLSSKSFFHDPNFWPEGVKVRPYQRKQVHQKKRQNDSITQRTMIQTCCSPA